MRLRKYFFIFLLAFVISFLIADFSIYPLKEDIYSQKAERIKKISKEVKDIYYKQVK